MREARVGVIIPSYNAAEFLEETIESVLAQTVPVEAVVVVDDGSPQNDHLIAERLARTNPSLIPVRQENAGGAAARNAGLGLIDVDFAIFLDADDRLTPEGVARHLATFEEHPGAVMVFGSNNVIDTEGRVTGENSTPVEDVDREKLALRVTPAPSQCMYRVESFHEVGRYDPDFRYSEDIDINFRLARLGQIRAHDGCVMEYRVHPGQLTNRRVTTARAHLRALEKNLGPGAPAPDPDLYRRARRHWLARYGQWQLRAALGQLRRGNPREAWAAGRLWLDAVPARTRNALFGPPRVP